MKTFIAGSIASSEEVNDNFTELATALTTKPTITAGTAMQNTPPASGGLMIQAGTVVVIVEANGYGSFGWPKPFPGGLVTVVCSSGDTRAHDGAITDGSVSSNSVACHFHAPGAHDSAVRVNYVAVGF